MDSKTVYAFLREHPIFNQLGDEELGQILPLFQPISLQKGEVLFRAGFPGRNFFIIVSGAMLLLREDQPARKVHAREHFGDEELFGEAVREHTAQALETTRLLAVNRRGFLAILNAYPTVKGRLQALRNSLRLREKIDFPWIGEREQIRFLDRKHIHLFYQQMVFPLLFLSIGVLGGLYLQFNPIVFLPVLMLIFGLWTWWHWLDWGNDFYLVTTERVAWVEKVLWLHDQRREIPLQSILSVNLSSNQLQRVFGYGDVIIRTYTGDMPMRNASHPKVLLDLILETQKLTRERARETELDEIGETIRTRLRMSDDQRDLESSPEVPAPPAGPQLTETITPLQEFLNLFRARYEVNGVITYRKHKFILLKHSWWLLLLLVLLISAFFARLINLLTFPSLPWIALLIAVSLLGLGYVFANWANDRFQITEKQIIDLDRTPLGRETKRSALLENILSLDYQRKNILQRLFDFGTVAINVGDIQLDFENVARPKAVQNEIFERYNTAIKEKEREEAQRRRDDMVEFLAAYHQENQPDAGAQDESTSSAQ